MTNQRPCRAFSNNNAPLQAVLVCLSSNPPPCLFVIPRTDFVPRFLSVCHSNFISNQPDRYSPAKVCTSNIFVLRLHCESFDYITSISFRLIFFSLVSKLTLARRVKKQITYVSSTHVSRSTIIFRHLHIFEADTITNWTHSFFIQLFIKRIETYRFSLRNDRLDFLDSQHTQLIDDLDFRSFP